MLTLFRYSNMKIKSLILVKISANNGHQREIMCLNNSPAAFR